MHKSSDPPGEECNVLVNISVLCNCGIEADNHYLLQSLAACDNSKRNSKLTMYFTINTGFANYLDMFPNFTESLQVPQIRKRTTHEQILPVNLSVPGFDKTLLHVSTNLKDFIYNYTVRKEIFDLQERHETTVLNSCKNFFSNNYIMDICVYLLNNVANINNLNYIFTVET